MKRQIRRNVFETNSSSMHSLTVMKKDEHFTPEEIMEGIYLCRDRETGEEGCVWDIWDDFYFGRSPFRALRTFKDKWMYACASLVNDYNDNTYKELVAIAMKYIPNLKKIKLPKTHGSFANKDSEKFKDDEYYQKHGKTESELVEYLDKKAENWGWEEVDYWESNDGNWWYYDMPHTGGTDDYMLSGFLKYEGVTLEEYLINKKYVVIQDGDEYYYWDNMKKTGLINMDAIDHEY